MKSIQVYIDRGCSPKSIYISRSIYNLYRLNRKAVFFILLIDNFTFDLFNAHHIFFILLIATQNMKQDLSMDIHLGLGVLATGN
jgi:hypothetical protein